MTQPRKIDWHELRPEVQEQWDKQITCLTIPPMTFSGNSDASAEERLVAINRDPALCAKVLVVANSAAQGRMSPVTSAEQAVVQLGQNMLQIIMSGYHLESVVGRYPSFPQILFDFVRNWSAIASITAFHLADKAKMDDREIVSTAALIARLGNLVLGLTWPPPDQEYYDIADENQRYFYEMDKWRVSTPLMGHRLAFHWGLPEPLPGYIQRQETPLFAEISDSHDDRCILVMCTASVVSATNLLDPSSDPLEALYDSKYSTLLMNLEKLKLTKALAEAWNSTILKREILSIRTST